MSASLVLDSEAVNALASSRHPARARVRAALEAAQRTGAQVAIPAIVLAELYRTHANRQQTDALLARETGIATRDTDRQLARLVGALLASADMDTSSIVDAHVVAVAIEAGGGVCLTSDTSDLDRLAGTASTVVIAPV